MYNTTRTRIRYNIDGSFSGTQTTRVGGMNMPISVPVQGTWQITVVSEKEFLMTIIAKGEVFPTSANLLIIDQNTLQDKDKGILVTRVPR